MRLIDADALIEFIENRYDITWENDYEGGIKDACVDILEEIYKMPTIESSPKWIPVTERLPEEGEIVLVSDGIDCAVAFWRSDADAWDDPLHGWLDSFGFDVKAWMSLPPVYQGE